MQTRIKVDLILPPAHQDLCMNSYTMRAYVFTLLRSLARAGFRPVLREYLENKGAFDDFVRRVKDRREEAGTYVIAVFLSNRINALRLIRGLRVRGEPKRRIVLVGPFARVAHRTILKTYDVDAVVMQEPEKTVGSLMRAFAGQKSLESVKNLSFLKNGRICVTEKCREKNLDRLPFASPLFIKRRLLPVPVWTYRGCPYSCTFCDRRFMYGDGLSVRSIASVVSELRHLARDHGVRNIVFDDCNFILNKKRTIDLCRAICDNNLKLSWTCSTRVDRIDAAVLRQMKAAGCRTVYYGIESGSGTILEKIGKGFSKGQCMKAVKMTKLLGMRVGLFLMIGCPGETKDTIRQTRDFLSDLYPFDELNVNPLVVLPGTPLYRQMLKKNELREEHFFEDERPVFFFKKWHGIRKEIKPFLKFFEICPTQPK